MRRSRVLVWLLATLGPPALTLALAPTLGPAHATNVAFAYLLVVLACAALGGVRPGGVASVNAFLLFNFFFIEPLHSFSVGTSTDVGVLVGFLVTALVVSALLATVERRREESEREAADARLLYDLSVSISDESDAPALASLVEERLGLARVEVTRTRPATVDDGCAVAVAKRANGDELVLVAHPREGEVDARDRSLLDAIAALTAAAADRVEQRVLHETDRQRSALLSAVSHDLRTPLAAMTAAAGALDDSPLARSIVVEGERLDRMVRNLLDLGRIEGGALAAKREVVPVDELIGAVLTRVRPRLGDRQVTLDVPEDVPAVLVDPVQLDQVLGNLVENAMVHTPVDAGLDVRAAADGKWVWIRVADHGPGIAEAEREAIFGPFVRGRSSQGGSGLGLAIARAYTTANGGTLDCVPTSTGSAFDLRLKAA